MTHTPTRYRRLEIEDVQAFIDIHGLHAGVIEIAPYDPTLAIVTLRNLPTHGRNHREIKNYAGWVSNQLEGWGAVQSRYDPAQDKTWFRIIEDATADED